MEDPKKPATIIITVSALLILAGLAMVWAKLSSVERSVEAIRGTIGGWDAEISE